MQIGHSPEAPLAGSDRPPGPIVAFDFDGTLTVKDSFRSFIVWRTPAPALVAGALRLTPALLRYALDKDRGRLKSATVRTFLRGVSRARLEAEAERFAARSATGLLRPDALEAWDRYRSQGARLIIVTASPELLVAPFSRRLGADDLIGTKLAFDEADRLTGALVGENCRGPEKVRRLRAQYGNLQLAAAYGDTDGDREMLAIADHRGMKVFKARPACS